MSSMPQTSTNNATIEGGSSYELASTLSPQLQNVLIPKEIDPFSKSAASTGLVQLENLMNGQTLTPEETSNARKTAVELQKLATETFFTDNLSKMNKSNPELLNSADESTLAKTLLETQQTVFAQQRLKVLGKELMVVSDGSITRDLNAEDSQKLLSVLTGLSLQEIAKRLSEALSIGTNIPTILLDIEGADSQILIQETDRSRNGGVSVTAKMVVSESTGQELLQNAIKRVKATKVS